MGLFLSPAAVLADELVVQEVSANGSRNLRPFTVEDGFRGQAHKSLIVKAKNSSRFSHFFVAPPIDTTATMRYTGTMMIETTETATHREAPPAAGRRAEAMMTRTKRRTELLSREAITPPHDPCNARKRARIACSMQARGWHGVPILIIRHEDEIIALTGSHRLAAAGDAGLEEIPCLDVTKSIDPHDLTDVFARAESAYWHPCPHQIAAQEIREQLLPGSIAHKYGAEH